MKTTKTTRNDARPSLEQVAAEYRKGGRKTAARLVRQRWPEIEHDFETITAEARRQEAVAATRLHIGSRGHLGESHRVTMAGVRFNWMLAGREHFRRAAAAHQAVRAEAEQLAPYAATVGLAARLLSLRGWACCNREIVTTKPWAECLRDAAEVDRETDWE